MLPEYQQYLLSRKLVPEKNVSYYAHWVSLYLAFSNRLENMDKVDMLSRFLDDLQSRKSPDLQVEVCFLRLPPGFPAVTPTVNITLCYSICQ